LRQKEKSTKHTHARPEERRDKVKKGEKNKM
jgi:hypothetical protein